MFDLKVKTRIWTLEMAYLNRCLIYELRETLNPLGESAAVKPASMLPDNIRWSELRAHRHVLMVSQRNWSATSHKRAVSLLSQSLADVGAARTSGRSNRQVTCRSARHTPTKIEKPRAALTVQNNAIPLPPPKHFIVKVKVTAYSFQIFYEIWSFVDGYQHVEETAVFIFRV